MCVKIVIGDKHMNIAICDDELPVLKAIAKITEAAIISNEFDAEVSLVTTNQDEIYNGIKDHEIDILFLDVDFNNGGKNGIEFALELRKINKDFKLIFITSHFEYVMLSFKCKTFDYIMKPVDMEKTNTILKRLADDLSSTELGLLKVNKDYTLRTKDILFIERNKSKATIYTKDSTYETCYSLNNLQQELPDSFVRVHRSYIVNSNQISKISKESKSIYFNEHLSCPLGQFNANL